jgi:hypothetical protein
MIRDWLLIVTAMAVLWGLWILIDFTAKWFAYVFDCITQYHAAWREAAPKQDGEASESARGTGSSDW